MTIRGAGSVVIEGVTAQEVFDFVLDPAQYRKADTKIIDVTKLAATADGMLAREDGVFLGRFRGSIITRYLLGRSPTDRRHAGPWHPGICACVV